MARFKFIKLSRFILLIILPGLFSSSAIAQQTTNALQQADRFYQEADKLYGEQKKDQALPIYQKARDLYLSNGIIGENLVDLCYAMGVINYDKQKFAEAIEAYKESVLYQRKITPQNDSSNFLTLTYIGASYIDLNRYDSAYTYFRQAEQVLEQYPTIPVKTRLYNELGYLSKLFGNYSQSINYHEKALKILKQESDAHKMPVKWAVTRLVKYNLNTAHALGQLGNYRAAINRTKSLIKYNIELNALYQNLASAYMQVNQPDSALTYLTKIILDSIPNTAKIDYYNSLGFIYLQKKNFPEALTHLDKAGQISGSNFKYKNNRLATTYLTKAQVYEKQENYPDALAQYQLTLQALHFTFNSSDIYQNPPDFNSTVSPLLFFEVLKNKASAFRKYYSKTRKTPDLEAALKTYKLAFQLANRIRKGYDSDEAKLFFNHTVSPTYEEAIATAFQLFEQTKQKSYLETAFALAEQSKAAVLAESLKELKIKKIPGINPDLLRKEADLKRNITALQIKLVEDTISARRELYRDHLRENEMDLAKLLKEFEKNKQYYQLKYDTEPVKVSQIQEKLDNQTAFVEYFVGEKNVYVFVITQNSFAARQLSSTAAFRKNWQALNTALYHTKHGFRYHGNPAAHRLYQQLLAPIAGALAGKQRLLIIPDKELCYLPFEALVSDVKTERYLIYDNIISYAYSGKLLGTASENPDNGKVAILAMAPFGKEINRENTSSRADLLAPLLESADEVTDIGGQVYVGKAALKDLFLQIAGKYDIIHLATHAKANNQDPLQSFIAFYPEDSQSSYRLYVPEIYNLPLNKLKLVILSACETGYGKLIQGEGIMSLARAFAYAGCPSTITTLWQAEDKSTAYITTRLHAHLKAGQPKDEALRRAKLDYLNSQPYSRQRSPVYWANFIFIGDQTPIYSDYTFIGLMAVGVLLVMLTLWLFYKRNLLAS